MNSNDQQIEKSRLQWNALANHWENQASDINNFYTRRCNYVIQLILRNEINPCKTLDVGCANGLFASFLAEKGFDCYGNDVSDELISIAVKRFSKYYSDPESRFKISQEESNPFKGMKFQLITLIGVLPYFSDQERYLKTIYDMVEDDGYVVASGVTRFSLYIFLHLIKRLFHFRPNKLWLHEFINEARTGIDSGGNLEYKKAKQVYSAGKFDKLFQKVGFTKIDVMDMYKISFLDRSPLKRSKLDKFLCRKFGWSHTCIFKKRGG